ncbi:glycosyltransferase family 4 protein [Obesumbacterium proteus]|uniref:N, N'-diacetylbacillosaminyl-diphospho-undecaprenol alpha-1,3-N-acetylgalactosaminyltransferase n=2 Tax=Hafniaceae TaxID=1903412 RepID=A0A172X0F6_HAFAL|nr:glycosyltransferase family 4 protein [Obesumbacterium proteus]ANF30073.1 N,N'-diacetylbacillosaminyl-diphospho-undecaprenol alpha-1,3-N-acetylgalactosaminyltransferase [Hafnia alvei]MCE9887064.1 glycosyltransferase family 4 protein [Obesumbacterium proteus]MCE9918368.1 glycosyltransferase family 4 protein [Obesumbacterium proteus]MCE9931494.1 glycosyltransferase family 4 protein [Obesumbacterium proteus]
MNDNVIAITANTSWYVYNFRANTIKRLLELDYDVVVVSGDEEYKSKFLNMGAKFELVYIDKKSKNPIKDIRTFLSYFNIYKKIKPAVILNFTPKPNIYSAYAGYFFRAKVINNISGLGSVFINNTVVTKVVKSLYAIAVKCAYHTFFQNEDDMQLFKHNGMLNNAKSSLIPGSGVNLERFSNKEWECYPKNEKFILVARLLESKGVRIYAAAAKVIKQKHPEVSFSLLGPIVEDDISKTDIDEWERENVINYLGFSDNVEHIVRDHTVVVLPSYYSEGVPKSLLEAAAMGKPILTTKNVGCKNAVIDGVSGILFDPQSVNALVDAMENYLSLTESEKISMGRAGRKYIEDHYNEDFVINDYIEKIKQLQL